MDFVQIEGEDNWPTYNGLKIIPNPELRRQEKGRLMTSRIRLDMDITDETMQKRCGICRQVGHFRNSCPNKEKYLKK